MKKIIKVILVTLYIVLLYFNYKYAVLNLESYGKLVGELKNRGMDTHTFQNILMVIMMVSSIAVIFIQIGITSILNYYIIKFLYRRGNFHMELREHLRIQIQLLILLIPKLTIILIASNYISPIIIERIFSLIAIIFLLFLYNVNLPLKEYKKEKNIFYAIQISFTVLALFVNF